MKHHHNSSGQIDFHFLSIQVCQSQFDLTFFDLILMALVLLRRLVTLSDLISVRKIALASLKHVRVERIEVFDLTFNNVFHIIKATDCRNSKRAKYYVSLSSIFCSLFLSNICFFFLNL